MDVRYVLAVAVLAVLMLAGCLAVYPPGEPLPGYVVLLTSVYPTVDRRCTGVAVDAWTVVTMDHCAEAVQRVVTQDGQESRVEVAARYPDLDVAVVRTRHPLRLAGYATFVEADTGRPALVFGACPLYFVHVPRRADYLRESEVEPGRVSTQQWMMQGNDVCGGDSGGPAVQDGRVVGLVHAVRALWFFPVGQLAYLVPARVVLGVLSKARGDDEDG